MEPTQNQLARPLPSLSRKFGTSNPSIHSERVSLMYMHQWNSFAQDAFDRFQRENLVHQVAIHDENELYTVGNELGLTGRFVRNLCDPVMRALEPLSSMSSMRFADLQAITYDATSIVPDVSLGLVNTQCTPDNVYLVGELKTPWTFPEAHMRLGRPSTSHHLEPLIGQLVSQMRMAFLQYGFVSTYDSTVFVKRTADDCFLLSEPIRYDAAQPSLRQLFTGFCLMALSEPRYHESPSFSATSLRGPPPPHISDRLCGDEPHPPQPPSAPTAQAITSTSVVLDYGQGTPMIVNCVQQLSNPNVDAKAVWLADLDGRSVIIKCWRFELEELFDSEAAVYERIWTQQPSGTHMFAKWISRGKIICSSVFTSGYAIVLEYRDGARLSTIWHILNELERTHIKTQSLNGINALRQVAVRLSDPGMHNMLYDRQRRTVTLLDFEVAVEIQPNTSIPTYHEMGAIFGPTTMLWHE